MGTRINRYYNNPEIGAAISNLASIFEPPAPTDVLAYAQAAKARLETQGLEDLYDMAADPNADRGALDRLGAATGQWSPTSGFEARDMTDATNRYGVDVGASTARRGQDITASTLRANNAADNARALEAARITARGGVVSDLLAPISEDALRTDVSPEIMGAMGFPEIALPGATGLRSPMTKEEVEGDLLLRAVTSGLYTPEDVAAARRSEINIEEYIDPATNQPVIGTRADAIGNEPFVAPTTPAARKFATYKTPDGRTGTAVLDPTSGTAVDQATGQPLPQGTITGDVTDAGGGALTTGTQGDVQKRALAIAGGLNTIDRLTDLVTTSPSSQGLVGALRGTAQDVMQTGNELGRAFGGTMAEVQQAVAGGLIDAGVATQMYDPNIPAIDMLMNVLAWQYAKSMSGDRVSNEMLRAARTAIGESGMFANQASTLTRLGQLRTMMAEEGRMLMPHLSGDLASDLNVRLGAAPAPSGQFSNTGGAPTLAPEDADLFRRYGVQP